MNSLTELKDKIEKTNAEIQIISFNGHTLETSIGTIMMGPDFYVHDGKQLTEKEIVAIIGKKNA